MKKVELVSILKAAELLGKDRQTITRALRDVEPDGIEARQPRYKLSTIVRALESRPTGSAGKSQEAGLTEARAELTREQTEAVSIKNAVARGEYLPKADIQRASEAIIATVRERLLSIPGKIGTALEMRSAGECEEIVRDEIYEALDELSRLRIVSDNAGSGNSDVGGDTDGTEGAASPEPD